MAKEKVFAVVGLGTFGRRVCEILSEKGAKVIAIDNQPSLIDKVKDMVTQAVLLDSTDEESLGSVPFEDVDIAVVAIGDAIEASILTTALLKRVGVPYILARAISSIHEQVLRQIGADEIVNIEIDEGTRVANNLIAPEVLDRIPISERISIAELYPPGEFIGKSLKDLDIRRKYSLNVVAIRRITTAVDEMGNPIKNEQLIFPGPDDRFGETDVMLVVGMDTDIDAFKEG